MIEQRLQSLKSAIKHFTFMTVKTGKTSYTLFAKCGCDNYRVVTRDGAVCRFRTKAHAHVAAEKIHELGLNESGYVLGDAIISG